MASRRSFALLSLSSMLLGACGQVAIDDSGTGTGSGDCADLDDGDPCTDDACENGVASHAASAAGSDCGDGSVCDGAGQCVECLSPGDCPPKPEACAGEMGYPGRPLAMLEELAAFAIAGDVNGDGVPDVAVSNSNSLSVLFGRADGTLGPRADSPGPCAPTGFADLTGDGWPDIVGFWGDALVYVNQGDGTFGAPVTLSPGEGAHAALPADLDADGDTDVLVVVAKLQDPWTGVVPYFNDGTGQLVQGTTSSAGDFAVYSTGVALADFDGDGNIDVALAEPYAVHVLRNLGNGLFAEIAAAATVELVLKIFALDFGGDGLPDILTSSWASSEMFTNQGDGTIAKDGGEGEGPIDAVADWNLDGMLDAVSFEDGGTIRVRPSYGSGFGNAYDYRSGRTLDGGIVTDLNGDGSLDVITLLDGSFDGTGDALGVQLGKANHTLEEPGELFVPPSDRALVSSDLDLDGHTDLVLVSEDPSGPSTPLLHVLRNLGNGTFEASAGMPLGGGGRQIAVGDVTGDGYPDVVHGEEGPGVGLFVGHGDGTFEPKVTLAAGAHNGAVGLGDLDGDGLPEIVTADDGQAAVLHNAGNGLFGPPVLFATESGPFARLAFSDLDHSGDLDVVIAAHRITILWSLGQGDLAPQTLEGSLSIGSAIALGDLDGDQRDDIAVRTTSGTVRLFWNHGEGQFEKSELPGDMHAHDLQTLDLDGDGDLDIVLHHEQAGRVAVRFNDGMGAFSEARVYAAGTPCWTVCGAAPMSLASTDLSGDGRPDLVVLDANEGTITILEGVCSE